LNNATAKEDKMKTATEIKTYINKNWNGRRNYECENVVACQTLPNSQVIGEVKIPNHYMECKDSVLDRLDKLYIQGNVQYYGWL